jgi:SpoVK/Ycf46/Vps4 family AAA+-type ATPase
MFLQPAKLYPTTGLAHWFRVEDVRHPWARKSTLDDLRGWIREAENADLLAAAGEKVMPLLLSGESRCGKTSTLCWLAHSYFGVPVYRANIGSMIGSLMGETTRNFKAAIEEAKTGPVGIYVMDEVDGIFQQRVSDRSGGGAGQEMNSAIAVALALIENLPPHLMLAATTNEPKIVDRAMLARFTHVVFPRWEDLSEAERHDFARSHQMEDAWEADSYAGAVQSARRARVARILEAS